MRADTPVVSAARSPNRKISLLAVTISGCCLASGVLNMLVPSESTSLLAHAISVAPFRVLGYVVAQAVFAPGPVNTHRILGATVFYLNLALLFSTDYRLILDVAPEAFSEVPDEAEGPRGFAALIYFSLSYADVNGVRRHSGRESLCAEFGKLGISHRSLYSATWLARLVAEHLQG